MQHTLANLSLDDPVLREVPRAGDNIQCIVEACQEWVAVEGGRFELCENEAQALAIYNARATRPGGSGGGAPSLDVAARKAICKKQKKPLLQPPVTRSRTRPRARVPTDWLLY